MKKDWIKRRDKFSRDYIEGVTQFLKVAKCHVNGAGKTRCPCKNCRNSVLQSLDVVERHLFSNGISSSSTKRGPRAALGSRPHRPRTQGKRVRGYSRNIDLDRHVNTHGRIKIVIDEAVGKPVCTLAPKLSGCIGTIVRETIPLCCATWKDVMKEVRDNVTDRVLEYFELDLSNKVVTRYLERQMRNIYKEYRAELYQIYCLFDDITEARANPPERLTNPEDWNLLCDRWETPEWKKKTQASKNARSNLPFNHRAGSKSFLQLQHELKKLKGCDVDEVDLFHKSHFCEADGWVNDNARDAYLEMVKLVKASSQEGVAEMPRAEICKKVLGHRSGHIKGLGWNPKASASASVTYSSQHEKAKEQEMEMMKGEIVDLKATCSDLKDTNAALSTQLSLWEGRWAVMQKLLERRQGDDGPSNA